MRLETKVVENNSGFWRTDPGRGRGNLEWVYIQFERLLVHLSGRQKPLASSGRCLGEPPARLSPNGNRQALSARFELRLPGGTTPSVSVV